MYLLKDWNNISKKKIKSTCSDYDTIEMESPKHSYWKNAEYLRCKFPLRFPTKGEYEVLLSDFNSDLK